MENNKQIDLEQEIKFLAATDRKAFAVKESGTEVSIFEISGYGLQVQLNRDMIHSMDDVEDLLDGIRALFSKLIIKELVDGAKENS